MNNLNRKDHWEGIYQTKALKDVSWYQAKPTTSLTYIEQLNLPKTAAIIDIGGGDSLLVDHLLALGYSNLSVLDVSTEAIARAKNRLGDKAANVQWIVSDITDFKPSTSYSLWHDRAAFHFLTEAADIAHYKQALLAGTQKDSHLIIGTFSENGPKKCSGIEIKQYAKEDLAQIFKPSFDTLFCENKDHETPSNTIQNFSFCTLKRN